MMFIKCGGILAVGSDIIQEVPSRSTIKRTLCYTLTIYDSKSYVVFEPTKYLRKDRIHLECCSHSKFVYEVIRTSLAMM